MPTHQLTTASPKTSRPAAATPITVTYGDGIGPEIMQAVLRVLDAAGARIAVERVDVGEKVYLAGNTSGIPDEAWDSLERTRVLLKAPITTPQGSGYKSLNVTLRKVLGLYANVRPCTTYAPFVPTAHPGMDVVIIRENEEDLYGGIEHRQTDEVVQCLKLISRPGTEKIVRYAFEYARAHGRRKVTCMTKDNIMKLTDGLFHRTFREIGAEYPEIEQEHMIIDIGAARVATRPERFDVIVTPNLYGDILSDIAAEVSGSVGLAGSANIGADFALFEAIHGSAPDIAGQDLANPSGLLLAAVQMLVHIGQPDVAEKIHNAWLRTLEEGLHTADIYRDGIGQQKVGTQAFADAVIERLGQRPAQLTPVELAGRKRMQLPAYAEASAGSPAATKQLVGIDVFVHVANRDAEALGQAMQKLAAGPLQLSMITNRGVKVWPQGHPATFCTDHWRCRFQLPASAEASAGKQGPVAYEHVLQLLAQCYSYGFDVIKTENLYTFDGAPGYSLGQGQ